MSGDVNVRITATDQASGTFRALSGEAVKFGSIVGASGALAQRAFDGVVYASTQLMRSVIADANSFQGLAERTGIAVEKLAAYKLIADQSGTTISTIESGLKMLSVSMAKNGDQFKKVGIDTQDVNKAFRQLADLFVAMPNGAEKTALVLKLLGRAGQDLVPVLNQGSKGIEEAEEKSRRYIDAVKTLAPELDKLNKQQAEIGINLKASAAAIATGFMPEIIALSEKFVAATRSGDGLKKVLQELAELTGGGTSVFSLAARGVDAYYLFGGGGDPSKRSASGIIGATAALPGGNSPAELSARSKACTLRGGTWDAASNTCVLKNPGASTKTVGPIDVFDSGSYITRDKATAASIRKSFDFENWAWGEIAKDREQAETAVVEYDEALKKSVESLYAATDAGRFDGMIASINLAEEAFARGFLSQDKLDAITASLMDVRDAGKGAFSELTKAVEGWGKSASYAFADFAISGKGSISDLVSHMAREFIAMQSYKNIFEPMFSGAAGFIASLFANADGGVYSGTGISAYSSRIVSKPTLFPFASGIGLMGEAGPEAILPLKRGSNGKLGVEGGGGYVEININNSVPGAQATARERLGGDGHRIIDVTFESFEARMASNVSSGRGPLSGVLSNTFGLNRAAGAY